MSVWATSNWLPRLRTSGSWKSLPSRIGLLLDMPLRDIERVLYFESYGYRRWYDQLERQQILTEEQYLDALEEFGDEFDAKMGRKQSVPC